jgi:cytochrome c oxidase subunit II
LCHVLTAVLARVPSDAVVPIQSAVVPAGLESAAIDRLWSTFLWVSIAVFLIVFAFGAAALVLGLARARDQGRQRTTEISLTRGVTTAVAVTVVILIALLAISVWTGRTIATLHAASAVRINVVGHQWWWEIEFDDPIPSRRVVTANEIHVPVDRPVRLSFASRDVIHSFWLPNLQGKRDLIPGYTSAIWINATRPGQFRAQCAEFCGLQHAHMALPVVAEPEADFNRWLDGLRQPARDPLGDEQQRGLQIFLSARCSGCHTVRGTLAHGQVGPDLTHIASRSTIGAGSLPNSREHLRAWILDPQRIKPGNQMPPSPMSDADLQALLGYLESLR